MQYPIVIRPLTEEEGGGYMALFPDLMGCMSDGETPEEALANALDAFKEWMETNDRHGRPIPAPGSAAQQAIAREKAMQTELDERIVQVQSDVEELREQVAHASAWLRFSAVTGIAPDKDKSMRGRASIC